AKEPVLNVSERGDRAFIGIHPDARLDHPWAGNVVDLCPVGSLLSKDFLHKARAWDLDKTASICPGCTQGCNITIDTRDDIVVRFRPRPNLEVNRHFICDYGRMNYRWLNRGDRIEAPLIRDGSRHAATDWDTALDRLGQLLRGISGSVVILATGRASTESLGLVRQMLGRLTVTAVVQVPMREEAPLAGVPNLALRAERAPNLAGAALLGYDSDWEKGLRALGQAGLVILLDPDLGESEQALIAAAPASVVLMSTIFPEGLRNAELVLPITTMAEENGTYVNRDQRIQRYNQAKSQPGMARPAWWVAGEVSAGAGPSPSAPATAAQAFELLGERWPAFAGITYADIGYTGRVLGDTSEAHGESQRADLGVM
ncbi:MAG TPA: molybdopterin-dependent oxidoreductase, partial [Gemmatimonadales bacterium]|nr:molybdopterin-dependent oxidoreductase [Gemmatimonadales bacterium]